MKEGKGRKGKRERKNENIEGREVKRDREEIELKKDR